MQENNQAIGNAKCARVRNSVRHVNRIGLMFATLFWSLIANATYVNSWTVGNLTWNLSSTPLSTAKFGGGYDDIKAGRATINITSVNYKNASDMENLTIPGIVGWKSGGSNPTLNVYVKKINASAFKNCTALKTISIPGTSATSTGANAPGVVTIGQPCFRGCSNLTTIKYNCSLTSGAAYSSVDGVLFNGAKTILKKYPEGKVGDIYTIPATVTELTEYCFSNTKLTTIYFQGNAPTANGTTFFTGSEGLQAVCYPQGATGWTNPWKGVPTYAVPKAVTGLSATQGTSEVGVTLTWSPNSIATSYVIYRSTSSSGSKIQLATVSGSTIYTDTSAVAGSTYYYSVVARNGNYSGASSAVVSGWRKKVVTLSSISIFGSSSVDSGGNTTYSCIVTMSDGTAKTVSPTWSMYSGGSYASISSSGILSAYSTTVQLSVTIQACYTEGGVTKTATKTVAVNAVAPKPSSASNVGFNPNGGTLSGGNFGAKNGTAQTATLTLTYGKSVYNAGMRATRTEPGYAFNGFWTAASGGSQIYDANGKYVPNSLCWTSSGTWKHTGNAMLYAQWHTHTVKFNPNGGTLSGGNFGAKNGTSQVASLQVTCGAGSYSAGMRATQNGAAFNGWWTATSGGSQIYDANGKFVPGCRCWTADGKWQHHCNAVLYARWATSKYSSVTFNPNGGCLYGGNFGLANGTSDPVTIMIAFGSGANNSGMRATRGGYMFMGWWTADSGGSQIYDASGRYKPNSRCWTSDGLWQHYGSAALYARWLPITLDGNADWVLQADGSWISGMITHGQYTTLQTAVNGSGTLTFHWKVSCEGDDEREWDYLEWLVDDVRQGKIGGVHEGWSVVSLKIDGTGTHTIQWRYCKDSNDSAGKDCGWIRNVWWSGNVQ